MKKLNKSILIIALLASNSVLAQTWTPLSGNLNTMAAKVGIGTTAPFAKLTVEDGNLALTSSAYPSDVSSARQRFITARTDVSILHLGTNPDFATGSPNGPMIQMIARNNTWVPGRINYFSYSTPLWSGTSCSQAFANWRSSGAVINMLQLHDYDDKGIAVVGDMPAPWTTDFGLMVDRGILSRKYLSGGGHVNLFEVKDIGGKAVAIIGNVPYPSTPNAYGLLVETGIMTEKVRVAIKATPEWADYVFADDYKLMPLKQLEQYIDAENHLPEVPSAEDVVKEGIDLGQMQAKLLQKVEELTLYVIQQQKEIDRLKKQVSKSK